MADGSREEFSYWELGASTALGAGTGYLGSKLAGPFTRGLRSLLGKGSNLKGTISVGPLMSETELSVVFEAEQIFNSQGFNAVRQAFKEGVSTEVVIGGRTIIVEPGAPVSGMTLFEENAFVLGKEAFVSEEELSKTVLHELYRLHTSTGGAGKIGAQVTEETSNAFEFAEKAYEFYFKTAPASKTAGTAAGSSGSSVGSEELENK